MHHALCPGSKAQDHIMILTAVELRTEQLRTVQQPSGKGAEMTDIIVGPQIIRRIIRLKVQGNHVVYGGVSLKRRFVAVNVIRTLLTDRLHILVEDAWMQHVVMVKKRDIIAGSHRQAGVGVSRYAFVFRQLLIENAAVKAASGAKILLVPVHVFPADLFHVSVLLVRPVGQTQLPALISLVDHRLNRLPQKLFRRIVKRHEDTEFYFPVKFVKPLSGCLLDLRKAGGTMLRLGLPLDHFCAHLARNSLKAAITAQPLLHTRQFVIKRAQRLRSTPRHAFPDFVKLPLGGLSGFFRLRQLVSQCAAATLFPLIGFLIKTKRLFLRQVSSFHAK